MAGPGGDPRPLATDADRERLIALLREHYAVGLFGLDELDRRVGMVLGAQFLDEAAAAVSDLPASAADRDRGASPGPPPRRGGPDGGAGTRTPISPPRAGSPPSERFRDPSTSTVMRVWVDPADQSRHYVPEPEP